MPGTRGLLLELDQLVLFLDACYQASGLASTERLPGLPCSAFTHCEPR